MRLDPRTMTPHQHEALLTWLEGEGLVPRDIFVEHFTVHVGRVSGYRLLRDEAGEPVRRRDRLVRVHFAQKQVHELPKELEL